MTPNQLAEAERLAREWDAAHPREPEALGPRAICGHSSVYLVYLNASQAALWAGYSPRTAPQQSPRLLKNVDVQAAIATQQSQQLEAVEVRIEDVLRDLKAIAHTDL